MHSKHNEGKSVVPGRLITNLKNKVYKYLTSILKNADIDKLDDMVDEYNTIYHRTIKMKPADVKSGTYINFNVENNYKYPKIKVSNHVRISK